MDAGSLVVILVLGLASGLVMSLVGSSAVMVVVPGLSIILGYGMHLAIGVSLLADVLASLAVGYEYWKHGNVDLRHGLWIALGSVAGAQLGAGCTVVLPDWFLAFSYGVWMLGAGLMIWRNGVNRAAISDRFSKYLRFDSGSTRVFVSLVLGALIGVNCGVFGAGGGVLIMFVLMFLLDYPIHSAIGTSTVIMAITAASASVGYLMRGNMDINVGVVMAAATIVGGVVGARVVNSMPERTLARIVGGTFMALGVVMTLLRFI
jgi:uncharacterized membrane protein YfcA